MSGEYNSILIKGASVIDPSSPFHLKVADILVKNGIIDLIDSEITADSSMEVIDVNGGHVGGGWCDIGAYCGEPGDEVHETIHSLSQSASAGGYTAVAIFSNDSRPFDNRHIISDIKSRGERGVSIIPIGAVSKRLDGEELAEMIDISSVSPALFTDGFYRSFDNAMLSKAMEYAAQFEGVILTIPGSTRRLKQGQVNESVVSARMGLPGLPGYEEVATLSGELSLASYSKATLFAHLVSHGESLDQLRMRREQGLSVWSSVSAMHLMHTEQDVADYNENFKILPPLRSDDDRIQMIEGLQSGIIDMVVSNHRPVSFEQKEKEFGASPFGAIGLETTFLSLVTAIPDVGPEDVSRWLSDNPRKALGHSAISIAKGQPANLSLFSLSGETNYKRTHTNSQSRNTPYREKSFAGRVIGTVLGNQLYLRK